MQRLRAWMRRWLGIPQIEARSFWLDGEVERLNSLVRLLQRPQPLPVMPKPEPMVTDTPSNEFFTPMMGKF